MLTAHGARVVEGTRAVRLSPGAVVTDQGTVRAPLAVRATGDGAPAGARHALATEPLAADVWAALGLRRGVVLADGTHRPVRALRSADDRLVLSLRTARRPAAASGRDPATERRLHRALADLLPDGATARTTHAWSVALAGGPVPALGFDPGTGLAWADATGDDGVAAGNLAGRTLADLLTGSDGSLTRLPWVVRGAAGRPRASAGRRLADRAATAARAGAAALADREERVTGRPSRLSGVAGAAGER